ncbi:putative protein OS=Streptomyces griseomycini OX=66895 GN=FHS37_003201 PE=4 SV=1 [Streptomyces griseomycini]|uniref:Uncharacterized protein n=1 Tax=Streptomyces griseomycini TaxID=66895 RepID=A0A7W7M0U3_9ACTN|nr:hypothetical protein [Streptomyces griseomycini]GGR21036.1 hypothetical protein GCM10015536_28300 [Streptomyces griseomycini]
MTVSPPYGMGRGLLSVPSVSLRRETTKDAELPVPRHEKAVPLRRDRPPIPEHQELHGVLSVPSSMVDLSTA